MNNYYPIPAYVKGLIPEKNGQNREFLDSQRPLGHMPDPQIDIRALHFHNPRLSKVGVEVIFLPDLRKKMSSEFLLKPQRVDFHHLLLLESGTMRHMVDFLEYELTPGGVLLMRPGQVQQWRPWDGAEGQVLLISSEALPPAGTSSGINTNVLSRSDWPPVFYPAHASFVQVLRRLRLLTADLAQFGGRDVEVALVRHELAAALLRLARDLPLTVSPQASSREGRLYALFAKEVEANYMNRWSVLDYAHRIGYSESALSRACVMTAGRTAKEKIDDRTALEAKRLLVHSQATASEIGYRLGFTQATNFLKFFKRVVGCTPMEFRHFPH